MIEAAEAAIGFISGKTRDDLNDDRMLSFALVRAIEIIGEACQQSEPDDPGGRTRYPVVADRAMRNRLIHGYFNVDHQVVWVTVTEELPELLSKLKLVAADDD